MNRTLAIPALLAAALVAGAIIFSVLSGPEPSRPAPVTPTPAQPIPSLAGPPASVPHTPATTEGSPPAVTLEPTGGATLSGTEETSAMAPTPPTASGPPRFTLIVTPVEARAAPGSVIVYTLVIEPRAGFDQPISLRLDVSALFLYRNSFDLGTVIPPYPQTIEYRFRVPPDVPPGITVRGVLSAEGGGQREEQTLVLLVGG